MGTSLIPLTTRRCPNRTASMSAQGGATGAQRRPMRWAWVRAIGVASLLRSLSQATVSYRQLHEMNQFDTSIVFIFGARPCGVEARDEPQYPTQVNPCAGQPGLGKCVDHHEARFSTMTRLVVGRRSWDIAHPYTRKSPRVRRTWAAAGDMKESACWREVGSLYSSGEAG